MTDHQRHRLHWLPDFLTVSRIVLIPVLVWAILALKTGASFSPDVLALTLFFLCAITDFLDGHLARKWKLVSDFGRMLDPIADKLFVAGCLIALTLAFNGHPIVLIPTLVIIFRDIFISGLREHLANANIVIVPTKLAKWKTAAEMAAIFLLILGASHIVGRDIPPGFTHGGYGVLWLAALLSMLTGFQYLQAVFSR